MLLVMAAYVTAPVLPEFTTGIGLDRGHEILAAEDEIKRFRIAIPGPKYGVSQLSGGNQQKILFGRWTCACRRALILGELTRGVDVGVEIIVVSGELREIVSLCSRVLFIREGLITGEDSGGDINEETIMQLATASVGADAA
ncbi:MAG: hypothetical protein AAF844_20425 [Pseudomonadota bacterium]